jgi:hypothetical protein
MTPAVLRNTRGSQTHLHQRIPFTSKPVVLTVARDGTSASSDICC